jgi:hypothetical protein
VEEKGPECSTALGSFVPHPLLKLSIYFWQENNPKEARDQQKEYIPQQDKYFLTHWMYKIEFRKDPDNISY